MFRGASEWFMFRSIVALYVFWSVPDYGWSGNGGDIGMERNPWEWN
jgi:hypothetical protein